MGVSVRWPPWLTLAAWGSLWSGRWGRPLLFLLQSVSEREGEQGACRPALGRKATLRAARERAIALASSPEGGRPQLEDTPAALQVGLGQGLSRRVHNVPGVGPECGKEPPLLFLGLPPFYPPAPPKGPIFIPRNLLEVCPCPLGLHRPRANYDQ